MKDSGRSQLTRRQFGKTALGFGAAATLGSSRTNLFASSPDRNELQYEAATQPGVTGANSLQAHAGARGLLYGAAVDPELLDVEGVAKGHSTDGYTQLFWAQTGILVAENAMKWGALRPAPDRFNFANADRMMRFAGLLGKRVRGHNLCWHEALPWWFKATVNKDNARQILTEHIRTVAGHFRGQLHSWDVVNEAIDPADGRPDGLRKSPWLDLVGADYVELAFRTAAEADPQAKLTYNDYGFELDTPKSTEKRDRILALLRDFKTRGVPIQAVGVQSHLDASGPQPGAGLQSFIREAGKMGLEVFVTEMDVNAHSLPGGAELQDAAVAQVYRNYLGMVLAEPNVPIALTWGITSAHSWISQSNEPWAKRADGARQRPLPFDDDYNPTPAFRALRAALDAAHPLSPASAASGAVSANLANGR